VDDGGADGEPRRLEQAGRERERAYWYREADKEVNEYMLLPSFESELVPAIDYKTNDQKNELFGMLKDRLAPVLPSVRDFAAIFDPAIAEDLAPLEQLVGQAVTLMPQNVFVEIASQSGNSYATLVRNNAHLNITALFGEKKFRIPEEDTMSVYPGFLGAYPNAFFTVNDYDLERFVGMISSMQTEGDYARLLDNFGVRRTSPKFWQQGDTFHLAYKKDAPIEYGLLDYNRLENR